jgi:ankyrin repeat protein
MLAAENGHTEIAKSLMSAGADTKLKNTAGYSALVVAIISGKTDTAKAMVEAGAGMTPTELEAFTSLLTARKYNGFVPQVATLGIDINAKDENGKSALMIATEKGHANAAEALKAAGATE